MARKAVKRKKSPARKKARAAAKKTAPKKAAKKAAKKTALKKAPRKTAKKVAKKKTAKAKSSAGPATGLDATLKLRLELEELYAAYGATLDYGKIDEWPDFFTDDCIYKLISRENFDLGLPLGTMFAEKRGGLEDRVSAVVKTTIYHERAITHLITGIRVLGTKGGTIHATASYVVLETLPNQYTSILNSGRYDDKIVRKGGKLLFREKLCIFDSALVPASIIYPI